METKGRGHTVRVNILNHHTGERRQLDKNLLRFHGDAAASAIDEAAINYQSPSIIAAGADAQHVSLLMTLINLSLSLVLMRAPALIEKAGLGKRGAVNLAFLNLCSWVPLTLAFLFAGIGIAPSVFAFLWVVNIVPGLLLTVQRDNWLSNLVPSESLGRYLGQRLAIKSTFYLGGFCLLGYMLDLFGGQSLQAFGLVFTVCLVASLVDFVIFTYMHEPEKRTRDKVPKNVPQEPFGMLDYFRDLREKKLGSFISFAALFYLSVGLSGPLYAVYMLGELHFTYLNFTIIIAVEYFARIVSAPLWGRLADKVGNIRVLGIVSRIIPLLPFLWIFGSHILYLAFVQCISGICWGAYDLCHQSYLYKVSPPQRKLRYIVYTRCLVMLATAIGGLAGAYIVEGIFPIFGSQILSVFLLSGLFRAAIVLSLMPKLVDLAIVIGRPSPRKTYFGAAEMAADPKRGLYYRRRKLAMATAFSEPEPARLPVSPAVGYHYVPRRPASRPLTLENKSNVGEMESGLLGRPLYTRANTTAKVKVLSGQAGILSVPLPGHDLVNRNISGRAGSRVGLYYEKDGWSKYMKETLRAIIRESQARRAPRLAEIPVNP